LRRLRTDYLDLLQLHSPPAEIVQRGEWESALEGLKRSGKVRFYGISCDNVAAARAALGFMGVSSLQLVVSLLEQRIAGAVSAQARERGVAVIARECLANGLLAKPESDFNLEAYCSSTEHAALLRTELAAYREAAQQRGISLSRLALEYATGVDGVAVALVGASRTGQLIRTLGDYQT
jgi:aryl-alcohol dehydrogenase-like predicted oxidoreductase